MSEVLLLVGPQGCGKTTYAKKVYPKYTYISQDEQGQNRHLELFFEALERGEDIIVDRINHLRQQRKRYLVPAKTKGYTTKIRVMSLPFRTCFNNIIQRENHPSIKMLDEETAYRVLRDFKGKYERPLKHEADELSFVSLHSETHVGAETDWFMKDFTPLSDDDRKRTIVIGDVHGCFDEVEDLLKKVKYDQRNDRIVFCGDIIDRGPKSKQVIEFVAANSNVHMIMGNHENKFIRYLRGNPITISHGLQDTIDQLAPELKSETNREELLFFFENLPYVIKLDENLYVVHAGTDPRYSVEAQKQQVVLFMRNHAPGKTFSDPSAPPWYEIERSPAAKDQLILFGHNTKANTENATNALALDGGCVFGGELRAYVYDIDGSGEIFSVPARKKYADEEQGSKDEKVRSLFDPFENRVASGLLKRKEKDGLVLYNYSQKCTYDGAWDDFTIQCRGLILEKETGKVISRPFRKFFNLGEREETQLENLTLKNYKCYDKLDGSLGIVYHYNGKWNVATRGSFESDQAKVGQQILDEKYLFQLENLGNNDVEIENTTFLCEIIYPENRVNEGARLVCDYGDTRDLIMLGAFDRITGEEKHRNWCTSIAKILDMPIAKEYQYTIAEMIELQETMPATQEGFVVLFSDGTRVKIKGKEYNRMNRILNGLNALALWEVLDNKGEIPKSFMQTIPEEIIDEINKIRVILETRYEKIRREIEKESNEVVAATCQMHGWDNTEIAKKNVGLYLKENKGKFEHSSAIFPFLLDSRDALCKYIRKAIRPTNNKL